MPEAATEVTIVMPVFNERLRWPSHVRVIWVSDLMTGQKAISTELFRSLELREGGFAIEAEGTR